MPVDPHTWVGTDFITAYRLNSELRQTNGFPFTPNGPGFHARRPIWRTNLISAPAAPGAGAFAYAENSSKQWLSAADTGAFVGAKVDGPGQALLAGCAIPNGEGGTPDVGGGLFLMTGTMFWGPSASANSYRIGSASWTSGAGTQIQQGVCQPSNTNTGNGPWFIDLIDSGASGLTSYTLFYQNSVAGIAPIVQNADGSGRTGRMAAFWASQTTGTKVASVPAIPSAYTGASTISSASLNALVQQCGYLFNMPPALKVAASSTTSLVANVAKAIAYASAGTTDTYSGFTTGTSPQYTTPLAGLYLCYAVTDIAGTPASGVQLKTGFSFNSGASVWGPICVANGTAGFSAAKVGVHNLAAGTTIQHTAQTSAAETTNGAAGAYTSSYMVVLYLGPANTPGTLPTLPDTTFLFKAGTPAGSVPGVLNANLVNDLTFMLGRPYLLTSQNTFQTGIPPGTSSTGTIVHNDVTLADNYGGWTIGASNLYTAQRSGWYLAVQETQMAAPSLVTTPSQQAGFQLSPAGITAFDWYQQQNSFTGGGGGAAAVGLYYLRAGDTIAPAINSIDTTSTTTSTISGAATPTHFELVWLSE